MIELNFAHWEISPSFDGIIHSHRKQAETMTHIPFPIALMGSECASSKGTRSKGKAQMVTLPDHIGNSLSTARFACSYARLDTYALPEHSPQNRLQNGSAVVEVSDLLFRVFFCMLTIFSVT